MKTRTYSTVQVGEHFFFGPVEYMRFRDYDADAQGLIRAADLVSGETASWPKTAEMTIQSGCVRKRETN